MTTTSVSVQFTPPQAEAVIDALILAGTIIEQDGAASVGWKPTAGVTLERALRKLMIAKREAGVR